MVMMPTQNATLIPNAMITHQEARRRFAMRTRKAGVAIASDVMQCLFTIAVVRAVGSVITKWCFAVVTRPSIGAYANVVAA